MSLLGRLFRKFLATRGYVLLREEPEAPPNLGECVRRLVATGNDGCSIVCLDNDVGTQSELLAAFGAARIQFNCPAVPVGTGMLAAGTSLPSRPAGGFGAVIDLDALPIDWLRQHIPWIAEADCVVIGFRLGSTWSEQIDLFAVEKHFAGCGLRLHDAIPGRRIASIRSPSMRLYLVFLRGSPLPASSPAAHYRANEARACLNAPIARASDGRALTGCGSFGFAGGVFNPGAIEMDGVIHLLARAERTPWQVHRQSAHQFFTCTVPWAVALDDTLQVSHGAAVAMEGMPDLARNRVEDFRLFGHGDDVYCNHAVISLAKASSTAGRMLTSSDFLSKIGVSRYNPTTRTLTWYGYATVDRPTRPVEKNWAMFSDGKTVFLIYSFLPYVLMACPAVNGWNFRTVQTCELKLPFGDDGLTVRNSVNPVVYDDQHLLHVVHQVYPDKQYVFRAVLIDRNSLRPVKVAQRPLARAGASASAGIHYVCAVLVKATHIQLFSGVDDAGIIVSEFPRARLDSEWIAVG